jgi:hypothetical protein
MRAQRPAPARIALTPAQVRDSVNTQRRVLRALDSLEKAGAVPAPMLAQIRTTVQTGQQPPEMQAMLAGALGGGGGGRGGRGGQNALVGTGDYKVTIIVGGTPYSKVLHVERVSGGEGGGGFFGLDDDERR